MQLDRQTLTLPNYHGFEEQIAILELPYSASELHGIICGYLCAGAVTLAQDYIRALATKSHSALAREASIELFKLLAISEQQLSHFDFGFELFLPEESSPVKERAKCFSEWCLGFIEALEANQIDADRFEDEDTQESFLHMQQFTELDYDKLEVSEEDESALMEVHEYARIAVVRLYNDIQSLDHRNKDTSH